MQDDCTGADSDFTAALHPPRDMDMCRARVVLCVALVLCAPLQKAESTDGLKLPVHVSGWDYGEDVDHSRFWDLSTLLRAFTVVNYEQMRPVLKKLNSGKPITVAVVGDSIVAGHAGCFHRDLDFLEQHLPFSDLTPLRQQRCKITNIKNRWLSTFMHLVNTTWPHPDHLVVNSGIPGTPFYGFARGRQAASGASTKHMAWCLHSHS
jgi:hypothetical protein